MKVGLPLEETLTLEFCFLDYVLRKLPLGVAVLDLRIRKVFPYAFGMFVKSESFSHLKGDAPLWVRFLSSFSSWVSQQLSFIGSFLSGTVGQHFMCNTKTFIRSFIQK